MGRATNFLDGLKNALLFFRKNMKAKAKLSAKLDFQDVLKS